MSHIAITRGASRQPFPDPYPQDFVNRYLSIIGQDNPQSVRRRAMQHGRYLAGFGQGPAALTTTEADGDEPDWSDASTREYEGQDDAVGSGIFDEAGAAPTVHQRLGVFGAHYSIPGYIARNPPFSVSDVLDVNGARVVEVPAGGMAYAEQGGRLMDPALLSVRPNRTYVAVPMPDARPIGFNRDRVPLARRSIANVQQHRIPVATAGFGRYGGYGAADALTASSQTVPVSAMTSTLPPTAALAPDEKPPASLAQWAIGGLVVGVAAGLFFGAVGGARR